MSETAEILRKARSLVAKGWCQGHYACDQDGDFCDSNSPDAASWCAQGALHRAGMALGDKRAPSLAAQNFLYEAVGRHVPDFNDAASTTHADVLDAFDRAIAAAEKSNG